MLYRIVIALFFSSLFVACGPSSSETGAVQEAVNSNPAADGFNVAASDSMAIVIADQVMEAMGGRQAWDNTHYISWTFLSGRKLLWDKQGQRVRIEIPSQELILVSDLAEHTGFATSKGHAIEDPDSLAAMMDMARSMWINDSYWLVMPFKLKDSGVTLTYEGEDSTQAGEPADVLQLTFEAVGITPQNKYKVWVGKDSHLVEQWAYFQQAGNPEPDFVMPWNDYKQYGDILLSGDRGTRERDGKQVPLALTDIAVMDSIDEGMFDLSAE